MRTSIDFPDELFKHLKVNATLQGRSLRDHVIGLIERGMQASDACAAPRLPKAVSPLPSITFKSPLKPETLLMSNAQINALLDADEISRYERVMQETGA